MLANIEDKEFSSSSASGTNPHIIALRGSVTIDSKRSLVDILVRGYAHWMGKKGKQT
jgi:hypothetical protein